MQHRLDPARRLLSAGPWAAELVGDELANISYAGRPVLRAVKAVVRDQDWRTLQPAARGVTVTQDDEGLRASFTVGFTGHGVEYDGRLTANFTAAAVDIAFGGLAGRPFRSNRIGLVVLHPPSDSGRRVTIGHPGGGTSGARFPVEISPHQPFKDIAALGWTDNGTAFRLSFTGDVFETEDQRNWTDASFKTYSTPLSKPFPVAVSRGDTVTQSLRLEAAPGRAPNTATADGGSRHPDEAARKTVTIGGPAGCVPPLGLSAPADAARPKLPPIPGLDAVMVELVERPGAGPRSAWAAQLEAAASEAAVHGAGLDIRVVTADPGGVAAALGPYLALARRLAVFDPVSHVTEPECWPELRTSLQAGAFRGELLAGARSHFTELNRSSRRTPSDADALTFSITPQMHSTETAHVIESVAMQRLAAGNALRLGAGRPVHVGPVTLRPRFNAVATTAPSGTPESEADELQDHPFTAAWTLASIGALTLDGVASVSYFETAGPRGIADASGNLYPVGELLCELAARKGCRVLAAVPDGGTGLTVYPVQTPEVLLLFVGNLSPLPVKADVILPPGVGSAGLEATTFGQSCGSVLTVSSGGGDGRQLSLALGPWSTGLIRLACPG
jgi:D-apionolactonase